MRWTALLLIAVALAWPQDISKDWQRRPIARKKIEVKDQGKDIKAEAKVVEVTFKGRDLRTYFGEDFVSMLQQTAVELPVPADAQVAIESAASLNVHVREGAKDRAYALTDDQGKAHVIVSKGQDLYLVAGQTVTYEVTVESAPRQDWTLPPFGAALRTSELKEWPAQPSAAVAPISAKHFAAYVSAPANANVFLGEKLGAELVLRGTIRSATLPQSAGHLFVFQATDPEAKPKLELLINGESYRTAVNVPRPRLENGKFELKGDATGARVFQCKAGEKKIAPRPGMELEAVDSAATLRFAHQKLSLAPLEKGGSVSVGGSSLGWLESDWMWSGNSALAKELFKPDGYSLWSWLGPAALGALGWAAHRRTSGDKSDGDSLIHRLDFTPVHAPKDDEPEGQTPRTTNQNPFGGGMFPLPTPANAPYTVTAAPVQLAACAPQCNCSNPPPNMKIKHAVGCADGNCPTSASQQVNVWIQAVRDDIIVEHERSDKSGPYSVQGCSCIVPVPHGKGEPYSPIVSFTPRYVGKHPPAQLRILVIKWRDKNLNKWVYDSIYLTVDGEGLACEMEKEGGGGKRASPFTADPPEFPVGRKCIVGCGCKQTPADKHADGCMIGNCAGESAEKTFTATIENNTGGSITVDIQYEIEGDTDDFKVTPGGPTTWIKIAPNSKSETTFTVSFAPTKKGPRKITITLEAKQVGKAEKTASMGNATVTATGEGLECGVIIETPKTSTWVPEFYNMAPEAKILQGTLKDRTYNFEFSTMDTLNINTALTQNVQSVTFYSEDGKPKDPPPGVTVTDNGNGTTTIAGVPPETILLIATGIGAKFVARPKKDQKTPPAVADGKIATTVPAPAGIDLADPPSLDVGITDTATGNVFHGVPLITSKHEVGLLADNVPETVVSQNGQMDVTFKDGQNSERIQMQGVAFTPIQPKEPAQTGKPFELRGRMRADPNSRYLFQTYPSPDYEIVLGTAILSPAEINAGAPVSIVTPLVNGLHTIRFGMQKQ